MGNSLQRSVSRRRKSLTSGYPPTNICKYFDWRHCSSQSGWYRTGLPVRLFYAHYGSRFRYRRDWPFCRGLWDDMGRAGLPPCIFLRSRQFFSLSPTSMSNSTADDLLLETIHRTRLAFESLDRLIAVSTLGGMDEHVRFRNKILRIRRAAGTSPRKKARMIAYGMKKFSLLCRLDDLRNELQAFLDDLTAVSEANRISASDITFWRGEFYDVMATLYVLDQESDEE